ncbi:MAG: hypothetical protein ACKOE7_13070, partial [Actinomycetota bacterium]
MGIDLTATLTAPSPSARPAVGKTWRVRIVLPSGTPAEIDTTVPSPTMGLVIAPDIWSLRPLYDDMVARLAREWNMAVCA